VRFRYVDAANLTSRVDLKIYERGNESNVIHNQTHTPQSGNFGNLTVTKITTQNDTRWRVEYEIQRNGSTQSGVRDVSAQPVSTSLPLDDGLQTILGVGLLLVIGGLFSARNAAVGAIIVPSAAGVMHLVGMFSGVVAGAAGALALAVGVAYNLAIGGPS